MFSMVLVVLAATFGRYTKLFIIVWSDEFARYAMVYMSFLGIAIGTREKRHYNMTVLVDKLPDRAAKIMELIRSLFTLFFYGFITYWAAQLCIRNARMSQITPTLKIPMWIPYFAVVLGMGLSALWTIYNLARAPFGTDRDQPVKEDAEI